MTDAKEVEKGQGTKWDTTSKVCKEQQGHRKASYNALSARANPAHQHIGGAEKL